MNQSDLHSQQGMTLVEILMASVMLSITAVVVSQTVISMRKSTRLEEARSGQFLALTNVVKELELMDPWVAPQPADTSFLNTAHDRRMVKRCFAESGDLVLDAQGAEIRDFGSPLCHFKMKAFKTMATDRNYSAGNPLSRIPVALYQIEMEVPAPQQGATSRKFYYTRYLTQYARY